MDGVASQQTTSTVAVGGATGVVVETKTTVGASASSSDKVTKVVVAVHGVGDQHQYATIQSVVGQFCRYYKAPPATPLGSFHNERQTYAFQPPLPAPQLEKLAFAEVYWATIPRAAVTERHTLEDAKKWASTIVERLRLRWNQEPENHPGIACDDSEFRLLKQVLTEMIQTVAVLERLCFLADRAGLFTFDLRKLLDDYLGDVQVVAEFGDSRHKIIKAFSDVMENANKEYPNAEIYVIAHSEGTVVSFLGLLQAFRQPVPPTWTTRVRGLMTIGSPIDKHLMLWPELFEGDGPACYPTSNERIQWCNYYDRGDPIGFELDDTRLWIAQRPWGKVFDFQPHNDIGFIRYPFPGKAHVDYWEDEAVFGHFIRSVVKPDADAASLKASTPKDDQIYKWSSYVLPYVGVYLLFFLAIYFPFKALNGYASPDAHFTLREIALDVAAVALFLMGITIAARIPRLTRLVRWRMLGWAIFAVSALLAWSMAGADDARLNGLLLGVASVAVIVISRVLCRVRPGWGLKPLILLGTFMFLGVAAYLGYSMTPGPDNETGKLWPVFLALGGFMYLWWLAALIFDLVFVWHVHVRQSTAMKRLRTILPQRGPQQTAAGEKLAA
ncbi:MAG: hypothetical protein ACR2GP_10525 [Burkholderiaceae bacterium]